MLLFLLAQAAAAVAAPAPAPAAPQGVQSYGPAFFAAQNPNSALDMVGRLPGFTLDTGDVVRGFEGAAGNVLIDGQRPASKSDTLDVILQRLPASKVARIDVIRGGAPGIDMQGKTVLANVITKKGGGAKGLLAVSGYHVNSRGDFASLRAEASGALGETTWEAALRSETNPDDTVNTGLGVLIFADGSPTQQARLLSQGSDASHTATGAVETPLFGGKLRINGRLQQDKFKEPETDEIFAPEPDIQNFFATQHTTDTEIGGRFSRAFGPATDLELVALRSTRDRTNDSSAAADGSSSDFFAKQASSEGILRAVGKHRFGAKFSVEAGAETALNKLDSRTRFSIDGANQLLPAANVQVEEKRSEAFIKTAWSPSAQWTVEADLRYETSHISSAGDVVLAKSLQYPKPRLAVSWTPIAQTQVRMRLERTVGQLDFNDFVAAASLINSVGVTAGNPDLNPQQAWVSEIAVEQQLWMGASVILTARHSRLTDVVDRGPVFAPNGAVFDRPTNIGSGTEDDFILDFTLPFDRFGWKGALLSGTLVHRESEVTDPTTGEKREISNLHPNDWRASFSQDLPRWNLNLGVDASGQFRQTTYRFNLIETLKLTTSVTPYAEWKPRPDLSVRLEARLITEPNVRLRDTLQIFPGPRGASGLPDIQDRQFHFPRGWSVRLLKNFG